MDEDLLTPDECAELVGLVGGWKSWNRTVLRHPALLDARVALDGRTYRYPRAAVEQWHADRRGRGRWRDTR